VATTTLATVDNILKEVYEGSINDQLQSEITALKRIERSSEGVTHHVGGKYVRFPIRTKRNHGIGSRNEMEPLPVARTQGYEDAQVKLKYGYGAIELSGQTLELADSDFQTFAAGLDQEISGMKEGLQKDQARQVYGTNTGILATATGGSTTTMVVPDEWAMYVEIGMIVDVYNTTPATTSTGVAREVIDVESDGTNTTITFDAAVGATIATGYTLTRNLSRGKEVTGFQQIVSDSGTIYNIDPTATPIWKSTISGNAGTLRALSEGLMIETVDKIRRKGGGKPSVVFCSLGVRRAYFNLLVQQRRMTDTKEFTGGFSGLAFVTDQGEIPIMADVDCQPNRMYFLNEKEIKLYNAGDWSFMNRDGSNWQRKMDASGTYDAYFSHLYQYNEIGTHRRNSHALLSDIIEG
jgi:hypothetical protein